MTSSVTSCEVRASAADDALPRRCHGDMTSTKRRPMTADHRAVKTNVMYIHDGTLQMAATVFEYNSDISWVNFRVFCTRKNRNQCSTLTALFIIVIIFFAMGDELRWALCLSGNPPLCFVVVI